jgi:hypothetical protein
MTRGLERRYGLGHHHFVVRGLVQHPGDWAWSSYRHWATEGEGVVEIESSWTYARRMAMAPGTPRAPDILKPHISESRCGAPAPEPELEEDEDA